MESKAMQSFGKVYLSWEKSKISFTFNELVSLYIVHCHQGPIVQQLISADPRLNFILSFFDSFIQKPVWDNFLDSL